MGIGERIRKRRKDKGLTLKELAGDRITPAQISAVEKGKCKPSNSLLEYIAKRLECEVEDLTLSYEEHCIKDFEIIEVEVDKLYKNEEYEEAANVINKLKNILPYLKEEQKGYFYYINACSLYKNEKYNEAFEIYMKALTHYLKVKNKNIICNIYTRIGNCLTNTKKFDIALGYYINAAKYLGENISVYMNASVLYDLSVCYSYLKRYDLARETFDKCLKYMEFHEFKEKKNLQSGIYMLKGILNSEFGEIEASLKNYEFASEIYRNEKNYSGMSRAINNAAICLWEMGDKQKAEKYFADSIEYKILSDDNNLSEGYKNLAEFYRRTGDMNRAISTLEQGEEEVLKRNSTKDIIEIFIAKFEYLVEIHEYSRAEIMAFFALDYIQKSGYTDYESRLYLKLSEMYKKMGDEEASLDYLFKVKNISG